MRILAKALTAGTAQVAAPGINLLTKKPTMRVMADEIKEL
jgi:hypothetical protein